MERFAWKLDARGPAGWILIEVQYLLQVIDEGFRSNKVPCFRTYPLGDAVKVTDLIHGSDLSAPDPVRSLQIRPNGRF